MSRLLPHPWLTGFLVVVWLAANDSLAFGTVLLALILGVAIPLYTTRFWADAPDHLRAGPLFRLVPVFLWDIVAANVRVARLVLGPAARLRPRFIVVPLDVAHPWGITAFTSMITLTPGTVSANISGDRKSLLVHLLDAEDGNDAATISRLKERYERPLTEAFPC